MPFKYFQSRRSAANHSPEKKRNWSDYYDKQMKMRGDIAIWLSPDVIRQWHVADRIYEVVSQILIFPLKFQHVISSGRNYAANA